MAVQSRCPSFALPCLAFAVLIGATQSVHAQDGPAGAAAEGIESSSGPEAPDTLNSAQQARMSLAGGNRSISLAQKFDGKAAAETDPAKKEELRAKAKKAYETAIAEYQEALRLDPKLIEAYVGLGELMVKAGRFDQALQTIEQALALDPGSIKALTAKGHAQLAAFKVSDAKATYDRLVAASAKAAKSFLGEMRSWLEAQRAKLGPDMAAAVSELDSWIKEREAK